MAGTERRLAPALAHFVVRRRGWVAAAWVALAVLLVPLARDVERRLDVAARVDGSESAAVELALAERFASPYAQYAVLVVSGVPAPTTASGRVALRQVIVALAGTPAVTGTLSYLDAPDSLFLGDNLTFVVVGLRPHAGGPDARVPALRAVAAPIERSLRAAGLPDARLEWTGEAPLNFDLRRASAADADSAERRALPLTAALLLVAFGSLAAAVVPVAAGALAISLALGIAAAIAAHLPLSILLQNVVSMLGLGLGIDYALLTVSRFREALRQGRDPLAAAELAALHAGGTILLSAGAVAVGFAGLLLVPLSELRSIAVGGLLVVTTSALLATTLVPALLAWLGGRVNAGRIPRRTRSDGGRGDGWRRWGAWVSAHPLLVLVVAGAPVAAVASQAPRLRAETPRGDWVPAGLESARALHRLRGAGRSGVVQTVRVLVELPAAAPALSPVGWRGAARLSAALAADRRVAAVRSLAALAGPERPGALLLAMLPDDARRSFVSRDGRATLIEVVPREGVDPGEVAAMVRELRARGGAEATGLAGSRLLVGGLPAFNVDYEEAVGRSFPAVVALVVGGTLLALCAAFRSALVPLKAVALNLLSVAAAFGIVVLVFQDGYGASLLGLASTIDGTFAAVPLIVFCIVFGLSMDYEVFLVARVAEARRAGFGERAALAEGLARTGGVITSAAAIMAAVFGAFTLGDFVLIKILGVALASAVVIDATLIRVAIGPALLALAGRWNWWPGGTGTRARRPRPSLAGSAVRQPALPHQVGQLAARADAQLAEDVRQVRADGAR